MGEVEILQELRERVVRIEAKIDGYNNLKEKLNDTANIAKNNEQRLEKIESNITWLWRTVAGALILGFIAAYIKWGG